jgi:hypothetical protein
MCAFIFNQGRLKAPEDFYSLAGSHDLRRNKSLEVMALQGIGVAYLLGISLADFYERN